MKDFQKNINNCYVFDYNDINDRNRINDLNIFYQKRDENNHRNRITNNLIFTRNKHINHEFKNNNTNNYYNYSPLLINKNNSRNQRNSFFPLISFERNQKNTDIMPKIINTNYETTNTFKNNPHKKITNSRSSIQILKTPILNIMNSNNYREKPIGGGRTDITNDEIFDKYNNRDYLEYIKKNREYQLENKKLMEANSLKKQHDLYDRKYLENIKIKEENDNLKQLIIMEKMLQKQRQNNYKNLLDEQIRNTVNNKLINENLDYQDVLIDKNNFNNKKEIISGRNFLNKNDYVEINPFNGRKYYIGESNLKNNTILNPKIQFRTNKYMFPSIRNNSSCY